MRSLPLEDYAQLGAIKNNTRTIGTEGQIEFDNGGITLTKKKLPIALGYDSYFTFPEETQKEFVKKYDAQYPPETRKAEPVKEVKFTDPEKEDEHTNHFANFFDNMRKGSQGTIEDPIFAFRAAAPVLACNESYFDQKTVYWEPVAMKKVKG